MKNIAFFFRNSADIDHMVPIVSILAVDAEWRISIVIGSHPDYANDPRIQYLLQFKNISCYTFLDFIQADKKEKKLLSKLILGTRLPDECNNIEIWLPLFSMLFSLQKKSHKIFLRTIVSLTALKKVGIDVTRIAEGLFKWAEHNFPQNSLKTKIVYSMLSPFLNYEDVTTKNESFFENLLSKFFGESKQGILAFDWTTSVFSIWASETAKKYGCKTIALPHGLPAFEGKLVRKDSFKVCDRSSTADMTHYDYIIQPSTLSKEDKKTNINASIVLGSPRNTIEWITTLYKIMPVFNLDIPQNKLKVVLFLRDVGYATNWDEISLLVPMITQFPQIHLVVRHHIRAVGQSTIRQNWPTLFTANSNVTIVADSTSSASIIDWSDLVLDCGTGMVAHAMLQNKNVLSLEYVNAFTTIFASLVPSAAVYSRDKLCSSLEKTLHDKSIKIICQDERNRYISEALHGGKTDVFQAYKDFLNSIVPG